jgi:hypothetical protein
MAKYDWNVVKLDNSHNVWGYKRTTFLLVLATLNLNMKSSKCSFKKTMKHFQKNIHIFFIMFASFKIINRSSTCNKLMRQIFKPFHLLSSNSLCIYIHHLSPFLFLGTPTRGEFEIMVCQKNWFNFKITLELSSKSSLKLSKNDHMINFQKFPIQ